MAMIVDRRESRHMGRGDQSGQRPYDGTETAEEGISIEETRCGQLAFGLDRADVDRHVAEYQPFGIVRP